jgi:hypothetical protein
MKARIRRGFTVLLLLFSLVALLWGILPLGMQTRSVPIYPLDMQLPAETGLSDGWMVPEQRTLIVEWPSMLRLGDTGAIRLTLGIDPAGQVTSAGQPDDGLQNGEPIKNVYDTHFVIAEARLEIAGVEYAPGGQVSEGLPLGKPVLFVWGARPRKPGITPGTIWLHLRFVPYDGGQESRLVLSAQRVEIQTLSFLGLSGVAARVLGSVGLAVSIAMILDELLPRIWKIYQQKRR